ncbi:30S ribosomal protein S17 [bacterium]|nr:30S ribosomal protein S17 [bacterium]
MKTDRTIRRKLVGVVVKNSGTLTFSVDVTSVGVHKRYGKVVRGSKRYLVHDASGIAQLGDLVEISETRPISKRKTWRIESVVKKA